MSDHPTLPSTSGEDRTRQSSTAFTHRGVTYRDISHYEHSEMYLESSFLDPGLGLAPASTRQGILYINKEQGSRTADQRHEEQHHREPRYRGNEQQRPREPGYQRKPKSRRQRMAHGGPYQSAQPGERPESSTSYDRGSREQHHQQPQAMAPPVQQSGGARLLPCVTRQTLFPPEIFRARNASDIPRFPDLAAYQYQRAPNSFETQERNDQQRPPGP